MYPEHALNGAFLVTSAGNGPVTREAARSRRFVAPARGVRYPAGDPDQELARSSAAVLGSRPGALLAAVSAAHSWGLPLPPWIGLNVEKKPVTVAVAAGANRPRRGDVRGRRLLLPEEHLTSRHGLTVTTPARTWLDCAELIPVEHLIVMGDAILRRRLASAADLAAIVRWAKRRRGVVAARQALPLLDGRSASPGESLVRAHLVLAGLPRPHCNLDIIDDGEWIARADLAWPEARLIVEYDGAVHLSESHRRHDAARRNLLQAAGWRVITLTANDLRRPWLMIDAIRTALVARTAP